jgi:hypothetical protein
MKLGFVSLPFTGHLNPMAALARKMRTRDHEVVFIGIPDIEPTIRAAGLTFVPYCENEFPVGSLDKYLEPISRLHGLAAVQSTNLHLTPGLAKAAFEHLPRLIKKIGVEALVIDTLHRFLELIPMSLNIPCVHIWNTLYIDGTVFPNIDIPVITVIWTYYGLPAKEMEQRITSFSEFAMLTVNDVKAIDSQTTSGAAMGGSNLLLRAC